MHAGDIQISTQGDGSFRLRAEQLIRRPRGEVFSFFADATNLESITPPWLRFRITSPQPIDIREGARIEYRLRLHGIPIRWRTLISVWDPPFEFVDEQLSGPYRQWVHRHTFEETPEGTQMVDDVHYRPRGGALIHRFFIRRDLEAIFQFRADRIETILTSGDSVTKANRG
ncbi:MAG: SRPBCC family protein [Phycisphaerales bacterium]